jgi:hypothetical protein
MLFVAMLRQKAAAVPMEVFARRAAWQYPAGVKVVGEYWPQTNDPTVVSIFEADSIAPIMALTLTWADAFDISVFPAVTAEEGLALGRQMMPG